MEGDFEMVDFGERLRALRQAKGLTQRQLALQLSLSKSVVSSYENGFRYPSFEVLVKIASIFCTTTDYLLGVSHSELLDVSGLSEDDKQMVLLLINRFRK